MLNSQGVTLSNPGITSDYGQADAVFEVLCANRDKWMTLLQISALTGIPREGSISSRIRDLRTEGYRIPRRQHPASGGRARVFEYRYVGI